MNEEEPTKDTDELLDWLCWCFASSAERFYPPEETAQECIDTLPEDHYKYGSDKEAEAIGWEKGQHARAMLEADEFFRDLEQHGYNPKARAEREIERSREEGLDLPDIDWSWYEHTRGEDDE